VRGSRENQPPLQEQNIDEGQENRASNRDREAPQHKPAGVSIQCKCSPHKLGTLGADKDIIFETLKIKIQTLKDKCGRLERIIEGLNSRCDSHGSLLESHQKEILNIYDLHKTVDTTYQGERYDLWE
jgi:hypothetical protein